MKIGQAVKERILQLCSERKITVNRLAILSGLTQSTLNNIISGVPARCSQRAGRYKILDV